MAPGFSDVRLSVMRMGFYGNDDARRGTVVDLVSWEALGDGDELEGPRDQSPASASHVLSLRRQIDRDDWGAYVAGEVFTRWYGYNRFVTPRLGLRLGRFDRAAAIVEASLAGAYLGGLTDKDRRSLTRDVDVAARTSFVLSRRLRLESRGRYRDLSATDGRRLRDVLVAAGVEGEVSPPASSDPGPNTWRVVTLFVGVGLRRALVDVTPDQAAATTMGGLSDRPVTEPSADPWALMVWVDLDLAINSQRTIW